MTMKDTRKYKQTELGLLPEDWDVAKLGDIGYFLKGNGVSKSQANSGNLCAVRYGELYTLHHNYIKTYNSHISKEVALFATKIQRGDILFACSGETKEEIGKCAAFVDEVEAYAGGDILILRTDQEKCSDIFLGFLLNMPIAANQKAAKGQGDAVVHISKAALENLFIPLPPIEEQRRIASALTSIDNLIDSLDRLIAKKRDIKQGAMQQLLSGKKRLKGFTEPWKSFKIDDLFDIGNGYTPSKANPAYWTNGTIPWFRMEDIRANGRILKDSIQHITEEAVKSSGLFPANSIILSTTATIGEHALLIADSLANQQFSFLVRKLNRCSDIDIMFFFYHCFILGEWCRANINDGGLMAVNMTDLKNYTFSAPSLPEQQAIASVLTSMDNELSALEAKRKKYEQIKQGMMQQLLTGKIRLENASTVH